MPSERASSSFRQKMTARGRGAGGGAEILNILIKAAGSGNQAGGRTEEMIALITSSRKPGKLSLFIRHRLPVTFYFPEIFSPLWSLAELVEIAP